MVPREGPSPRVMTFVWQPADGPALVVHNHYGDATGTPAARLATAADVGDSLLDVVGRGDVPCVILGDFNAENEELPVAHALASAGVLDLGVAPTAAPANSVGLRRIDHVYANTAARRMLRHYEVDWGHSFPTHAVQRFVLGWEKDQKVRKWVTAPPLPAPTTDAPPPGAAWDHVWAHFHRHVEAALATGDPDTAWAWLEAALLAFRAVRAQLPSTPPHRPSHARWQNIATCSQRDAAPQSMSTTTLLARKRYRRLACVVSAWGTGGEPRAPSMAAWDAQHKAEACPTWRALLGCAPERRFVEELLTRAKVEFEAAAAADRAGRRQSFKEWADQIGTPGSAAVYKWIRNGAARLQPVPVRDPSGPDRAGPQGNLDAMDRFWWGLWGRPERDHYETDRWFGYLQALPRPPPPSPLTGRDLQRILGPWPARKAPGVDGWRTRDLKDLPLPALDLLARFLRLVEERGRWPAVLREAMVAMLPKKGTAAPDDRRPIVLLAIMYRLWAKVRAQEVQAHLVHLCILATGSGASAETLAADLALLMQRARAQGEHVDGLALDWRKCYDHMPLSVVEGALRAAGFADALVGPIIDMYRAPRRIVADGLCGERRHPTHCIPAGCPAATMVLALITYCWRCELHRIELQAASRTYVDDMTAHRLRVAGEAPQRGRLAIDRMQAVSGRFEADFDLDRNLDKSARFSSDPAVRAALSGTAGETVTSDFVDLGADQPSTAKPSLTRRTERTEETIRRAGRAALLPLPLLWRGRVNAGSATAVGCYATPCGPVPLHDARLMRGAVFSSCWRSPFRVARELAFDLFLPWRADPMAHLVVRPWEYLHGALKRGVLTLAELRESWHSCAEVFVGPLAAAKQAIKLAGLVGDVVSLLDPRSGCSFSPLTVPIHLLRTRLLAAFRAREIATVVARRGDVGHWDGGVDRWATLRVLRGNMPEDRAAALRSVMVGGAFCERVAAKWTGGDGACRHCGQQDSLLHRFWDCPKWAAARTEVAADLLTVRASLPLAALTHGTLPLDAELERLRLAAERDHGFPAPRQVSGALWTDGSAIHPADPALRRAAWSMVWRDGTGWHSATGRVPGRQTVGRAELCAAVYAYRCCPCPDELVIDNQYVAYGIANCRRGRTARYLGGPDADLWELLIQARPQVDPIWIASHLEQHEAVARGWTPLQWLGNQKADRAANVAVIPLRPTPDVVRRRQRMLEALAVAQKVIAAVQVCILAEAHQPRAAVRKRAGDRRKTRMTLFARARNKPKVRIRRAKPAHARPPTDTWPGIHNLVPVTGPLPQGCKPVRGVVRWAATCTKCGVAASDTSRWAQAMRTRCPAPEGRGAAVATQQAACHDLRPEADGFRCSRCDRCVPSVQRAKAARTRCPVPLLKDDQGRPVDQAMRAMRRGLQLAAEWRALRLAAGRHVPAPAHAPPPPAPAPMPEPGAAALRWRDHLLVRGGGMQWCLLCSSRATARSGDLSGSPCDGPRVPSAELCLRLRARVFDDSLRSAPERVRGRARAIGWTPLIGPPPAPPPDSPAVAGRARKRALAPPPAKGPLDDFVRRVVPRHAAPAAPGGPTRSLFPPRPPACGPAPSGR